MGDLVDRVGITPANLAVLKNGRAKVVRFSTLAALCEGTQLPARRPAALGVIGIEPAERQWSVGALIGAMILTKRRGAKVAEPGCVVQPGLGHRLPGRTALASRRRSVASAEGVRRAEYR